MKRLLQILVLITQCILLHAQAGEEYVLIYFKQGYSDIEADFRENESRINEFVKNTTEVMHSPNAKIQKIHIVSCVSPEGTIAINTDLTVNRAKSAKKFLLDHFDFPEEMVEIETRGIDWTTLTKMIQESDVPYQEEVLCIIRDVPERKIENGREIYERNRQLQALHGGVSWDYIYKKMMPDMRNAQIQVVYAVPHEYIAHPAITPLKTSAQEHISQLANIPILNPLPATKHVGSLYVKTNIPALGLLIANAGVEYCFAEDMFSINFPIYYSAVNYFSETLKFRTFAIQPEFRFWIPGTKGLFVGAHFGLAYYNFAFNGEYRYQDHGGKSPAIGGGLSAGYRLPLTSDRKWNLEFHVGGGVYPLYYDRFYNIHNGRLVDTHKKTYFGIDNVGISLSYRFDLTKRIK